MQPDEHQTLQNQPSLDQPPAAPFVEQPVTPPPQADTLSWQASEYVQHDKGMRWFLVLCGIACVLLLIDVFLIRSWTFGILLVIMTAVLVIYARRPPHLINYSLSPQSLKIDEKQFLLDSFRAFGVIQEEALHLIQLVPIQRFMPPVSIYFPVEEGERIVDILGSVLPMETMEPDLIDRVMQRVRF